jgi:hypothetical protein
MPAFGPLEKKEIDKCQMKHSGDLKEMAEFIPERVLILYSFAP